MIPGPACICHRNLQLEQKNATLLSDRYFKSRRLLVNTTATVWQCNSNDKFNINWLRAWSTYDCRPLLFRGGQLNADMRDHSFRLQMVGYPLLGYHLSAVSTTPGGLIRF
jgi:hypothetical protein